MINRIKKYKILFIDKNALDIKEINLNTFFIYSCLFLIVFTFIMFVALYSTDLNKIMSLYEIRKHNRNNRILQTEIEQQNARIEALLFEINEIKDRDENLRNMLKMPSVDKDTRELGVGGNSDSVKTLNDLNYLLPDKVNLNTLPKDLDFIKRSINFENISYNDIQKNAENNLDKLLHYPAIYPVSLSDSRRTSRYGYRVDPFTKRKKFHEGDDFSSKSGVDVISTANGIVKTSKKYGSFGNYIEVDHGNGYVTVYGHLSKRFVKRGEKVVRGQKIGEVGNTGRSTAPHLHYEVQHNNKHVNPAKFYFELNS